MGVLGVVGGREWGGADVSAPPMCPFGHRVCLSGCGIRFGVCMGCLPGCLVGVGTCLGAATSGGGIAALQQWKQG
jgi:hypothetical protein